MNLALIAVYVLVFVSSFFYDGW